jgi:phenylalanyl-tRNA synthetase beta chain
MKFSERWLRALVDPPIDTKALCDGLTMAGFEVEDVTTAAPPFSRVVVGRIVSVAAHPNADRLTVCSVDVGEQEPLAIVCGAPNARAGMLAPCALEGASLPGGVAISRTKMRGVESQGMLCSAKELGLADDASGLYALPADLAPGTNLRDALALDDALITIKVLPNRPDCLSIVGIAREVRAFTRAPLSVPTIGRVAESTSAKRRVRIEDEDACPRFAARVIEGIDARAPTPAWMRERIERAGLRSISAVVDITNYVMLELGQPLHAYDNRLLDGDIVVRFAREGETLTLLNGDVLKLTSDLLLVADEKKPLGLAGIMGGEHSGIASDTTSVYLEGAFWKPAVIQGKMRRLGFTSDAGYRFERGVDFELGPKAVERATALMVEICGGKAGPLSDAVGPLPARPPVRVDAARITRILGIALPAEAIADVFARLALPFTRDGDAFVVTPPSYRFDIAIEEDLIEEVARIVGYDAIPATPLAHVTRMLRAAESVITPSMLKRRLAARDWQEIVTFSFVSSDVERVLDPAGTPITVMNPIAAHLDVMRTTLLPGLIETLRTNLARKAARVRIFENARVFLHAATDDASQPLRIGGLAYGGAVPEQWGEKTRPVDFFDVKADLEALAAPRALVTRAARYPWLHPGRSAEVLIDGEPSGWIGELDPKVAHHFELTPSPIVFEVAQAALTQVPIPAGKPVSRLPIVRRDLAVVLDDAISVQDVLDALREANVPSVVEVRPFDLYRGPGVPSGKKSLAILVLIQDTARTLTDAEIEGTVATLFGVLQQRFGGLPR